MWSIVRDVLTSPCITSAGLEIAKITAQVTQIARIAWFSVLQDIEAIGWTTARYLRASDVLFSRGLTAALPSPGKTLNH